ncbi:hypothetical protein DPMN_125292 [Dreissena polymorpha]|uniref:Uncharacterized protein n=1 Tax=Dreissena polymorpha TaxID=45954 RepID=A0A9D4JX17_DREPO|nr:hypothetical protein DPMN_125292 [Dreissena polymorpha]
MARLSYIFSNYGIPLYTVYLEAVLSTDLSVRPLLAFVNLRKHGGRTRFRRWSTKRYENVSRKKGFSNLRAGEILILLDGKEICDVRIINSLNRFIEIKTTRDTYWGTPAINNRYNNAQSSELWLRGLLDCQRVDLGVYIKLAVVYS